ncbi:MAG TPA: type III pantothenate kinase [Gammaproteobacteria bacterium]|nr:type III pantothenate kinase [Gammaproteobacteria bacterium]
MKLLLDLGNTRLKAALGMPDGRLVPLGEAGHRAAGMAVALDHALGDTALAGVTGALCANVAGAPAGDALATALGGRGVAVEFLRPGREAGGVRCAYAEPARLGADRWAALLGARGLEDGACLVVDAGSALTIDALSPGGQHLGGWILPGLAMMVAALEARTGDLGALRRASQASPPADFPADTAPAMEGGALLAACGAVRLARKRLECRCRVPARLLLAGGDAARLVTELDGAELQPDLVLRGLARLAADKAC